MKMKLREMEMELREIKMELLAFEPSEPSYMCKQTLCVYFLYFQSEQRKTNTLLERKDNSYK